MRITKTTILTPEQSQQLDALWNLEYPKNLKGRFELLLKGIERFHHHLMTDDKGQILGWATDFYRDGEIWFAIIVNGAHQGKGLGRLLLDSLKQDFDELNGWLIDHDKDVKEDGTHYRSPKSFYLKNGFEILEDIRIEADIISAVKIRWTRS